MEAPTFSKVAQFDLLGDSDTILGDHRRSKLLLQNNIPTLGPKGHLHGVRQFVDTVEQCPARLFAMCNIFS